jgi:hypothetical protein
MFRRETTEIARCFEHSARILDQRLEEANDRLVRLDVTVEDHSNRSGFDESGLPIYLWSYWFEQKVTHNSCQVAFLVELSYLEPLTDGNDACIDLRWVADVSKSGAGPLFRTEETESVSFGDLKTAGIAGLVRERLELARRAVPRHLLTD